MNTDSTRTSIKKNKGGRPSKLTDKFLDEVEKIVSKGINAIIYTDIDILRLANMQLSEAEKVNPDRWKKWKMGKLRDDNQQLKRFRTLITSALLIQKVKLFDKYENDPKGWQKWSWIIERKFKEWNLKNLSESTVQQNVTIQLAEQNELDGLIGGMVTKSISGSTTPKSIEGHCLIEEANIVTNFDFPDEIDDDIEISSLDNSLIKSPETSSDKVIEGTKPKKRKSQKINVDADIDKLW